MGGTTAGRFPPKALSAAGRPGNGPRDRLIRLSGRTPGQAGTPINHHVTRGATGKAPARPKGKGLGLAPRARPTASPRARRHPATERPPTPGPLTSHPQGLPALAAGNDPLRAENTSRAPTAPLRGGSADQRPLTRRQAPPEPGSYQGQGAGSAMPKARQTNGTVHPHIRHGCGQTRQIAGKGRRTAVKPPPSLVSADLTGPVMGWKRVTQAAVVFPALRITL